MKGVFDAAIKGVSAVIYIASVNIAPDPNRIFLQNNAAISNALRAATKESSVICFTQASSAGAALNPLPPGFEPIHLNSDSWNETGVKAVWAPPPYELSRAPIIYKAAKVGAEQTLWKFLEEEKPKLVVNTVLPSFTRGKLLNKEQNICSDMMIRDLYNGDASYLRTIHTCMFLLNFSNTGPKTDFKHR